MEKRLKNKYLIFLMIVPILCSCVLFNTNSISAEENIINNKLVPNADVPFIMSEFNDDPKEIENVIVHGSAAYAIQETSVIIYNVSNLSKPTRVNSFNVPTEVFTLTKISIAKNNLFVIDDSQYIYRFSIANPFNPIYKEHIFPAFPHAVAFDENYMYSAESGRLRVCNFSDPNNIEEIDQCAIFDTSECISLSENYALLGSNLGLTIIDITNVSDMFFVKRMYTENRIRNIYSTNNTAYLTDTNGAFHVVNVTDKYNPNIISSLFFDDYYNLRMSIVGNECYLVGQSYLSYTNDGLTILDLEDPFNTTIIGKFFDGGDTLGVFVNGSYAFLSEDGDGLEIIDVSDATNPVKVAQTGGGNPSYICGSGEIAILAENAGGIDIINISNVLSPELIRKYDTGGIITSACIDNDLLFLTNHIYGLEILNFTDPRNPTAMSTFYDGGFATEVIIRDNIAFVADGTTGLDIINITNPYLPTKISQWSSTISAVKVKVYGDRLFLLEYERDSGYNPILSIIDISDLANPILSVDISYPAITGFEVVDDTLYIAANGFEIFDISIPGEITELEQISELGVGDINLVGNKFFTTGSLLLRTTTTVPVKMFEIKSRIVLNKIGEFSSEGFAFSFQYLGGYILLADAINEFRLLGLDRDIDGIYDFEEENIYGTNPDNPDTDLEGLSDFDEIFIHYTDPLNPDTDGEGLDDFEELTLGLDGYLTNPLDRDTDKDGYTDFEEYKFGSDPTDPLDYPHFRVWTIFVGIYSTITLILILSFLTSFIIKQLQKREVRLKKTQIQNAVENEKRLFKYLIFMANKQKHTIMELSEMLTINITEIQESFSFWNKTGQLEMVGIFDSENELFTRTTTHQYPKNKASCYYCSTKIAISEIRCSECGFEILRCSSCDKPIQYGEIISTCPYCEAQFHIDHLLEDIEKHEACPNCHLKLVASNIVVLTQLLASRFDVCEEK